jgi:hypothetical protein
VKYDRGIFKIIPFLVSVLWIFSFAIICTPRPSFPDYSSEVANLQYNLALAGLMYGSALGIKTFISNILKDLEKFG